MVGAERDRRARGGSAGLGGCVPADAASSRIELGQFKDGFFPYQGHESRRGSEILKADVDPDVILTHGQADAHQDHREVCQLTWNLFRDHLILEYEIPSGTGI